MKAKIRIILIIGLLLCLTGCQGGEAAYPAAAVRGAVLVEEALTGLPSPAVEREPYFTASYRMPSKKFSIDIPLSDCTCEYADTDFQIYSKFIPYDIKTFPHAGTIIYMQTPTDFKKIFLPQDYYIDKENGVIYLLMADGKDSSYKAYKYFAAEDSRRISGAEVELNATVWKEYASPRVYRVYDEERDTGVFKACQEAFDSFEHGDFSVVKSHEGMHFCGEFQENHSYRRMDVNGDGLPELIVCLIDGERCIHPVEYIYAYTGGMSKTLELVYDDRNDYTEFLFPGTGENLIYDYRDHGIIDYGSFTRYTFDGNWKRQPIGGIAIYGFEDVDYYAKEDETLLKALKEDYPDTFGSRGGGSYYFITRPIFDEESGITIINGIEEEITEKEFLEIYREMTGLDFFEENTDFLP